MLEFQDQDLRGIEYEKYDSVGKRRARFLP